MERNTSVLNLKQSFNNDFISSSRSSDVQCMVDDIFWGGELLEGSPKTLVLLHEFHLKTTLSLFEL